MQQKANWHWRWNICDVWEMLHAIIPCSCDQNRHENITHKNFMQFMFIVYENGNGSMFYFCNTIYVPSKNLLQIINVFCVYWWYHIIVVCLILIQQVVFFIEEQVNFVLITILLWEVLFCAQNYQRVNFTVLEGVYIHSRKITLTQSH